VLDLLGWSHRNGRLHLLLILPDESRALISAEWTDLKSPPKIRHARGGGDGAHASSPCLGSLSQLLQARLLVDALLRHLDSSGKSVGQTEGNDREPGVMSVRSPENATLPSWSLLHNSAAKWMFLAETAVCGWSRPKATNASGSTFVCPITAAAARRDPVSPAAPSWSVGGPAVPAGSPAA
jgi:hypothetical protein